MLIPASFKLDRRPYSVSLVRHTKPTGTMGKVYYELRLIEIATHSGRSQRKFTREELTDTFWHEVTHAILRDMDHLECNPREDGGLATEAYIAVSPAGGRGRKLQAGPGGT